MGFCFFNNVAVAIKYALQHYLQRVAVVDFDVHHGNGTEDILAMTACADGQHLPAPVLPLQRHDHDPAPNMVNVPVPAYTRGMDIRGSSRRMMCWMPGWRAFKRDDGAVKVLALTATEDDMGQAGSDRAGLHLDRSA